MKSWAADFFDSLSQLQKLQALGSEQPGFAAYLLIRQFDGLSMRRAAIGFLPLGLPF